MATYQGPILDAHHHLWDLAMGRHRWLVPTNGGVDALGDLGPIRRSYLVEDYLADARGQNIVGSVCVEALWDRTRDPVEEIEWLETLDKSSGIASRYVAYVPLADPHAEHFVARQASFPRVIGVREMLSWHPSDRAKCFAAGPAVTEDQAWRRGVAALGRHGLHLELMLYPYQADQVAALAHGLPDQQFVLNHCASPVDRDAEGMARWRTAVRQLGQLPNVAIKISALPAYDPSPTPESTRDVIMHCIESFGVERCMFGSDYPVGRLWASFAKTFDDFRQAVSDLTVTEQAALFHDNTCRFYRMPQRRA